MKKYKTRLEIAAELGMPYITFYRKLLEKDIRLPKGLVNQKDQQKIHKALGFSDFTSDEDADK
jgi:hypothetical protein